MKPHASDTRQETRESRLKKETRALLSSASHVLARHTKWKDCSKAVFIKFLSIYTLSDLGNSSNLIG